MSRVGIHRVVLFGYPSHLFTFNFRTYILYLYVALYIILSCLLLICLRVLAWSRWLTVVSSMFLGMYWFRDIYGAGKCLYVRRELGVRTNPTRIHDLYFYLSFILYFGLYVCFLLIPILVLEDLYLELLISKMLDAIDRTGTRFPKKPGFIMGYEIPPLSKVT